MNYAIILSGGTGSRMKMGSLPKQYYYYRGRPILSYSLKTFDDHPKIDALVLVADQLWRDSINLWMRKDGVRKFYAYADPGLNRQLSIRNGLRALDGEASATDTVIIHDAARPLVSAELISRCLDALPGHDGTMPYLPAKDTFYLLDECGRVSKELPRRQLAAGQAPEAFYYGRYSEINELIPREQILQISGSTQMALTFGMDVVSILGEERNFKITTRDDLLLMDRYMEDEKT